MRGSSSLPAQQPHRVGVQRTSGSDQVINATIGSGERQILDDGMRADKDATGRDIALGFAATGIEVVTGGVPRRIVAEAAVEHLEGAKVRDDGTDDEVYEDLSNHYRQRLKSIGVSADPGDVSNYEHYVALLLETLRVERETAIRLRNEGRINDTVLRRLERELDLSESRLIDRDGFAD